MNQVLFINPTSEQNSRIQKEAGGRALIAASIGEALGWITNPSLAFSAIYVNPNDPSYSALKFLETSLLERPATPIYFIDQNKEVQNPTQISLLESLNLKGVWNQQALPLQGDAQFAKINTRSKGTSSHPNFIAVPIIDFINSSHYAFDVFIEDASKKLLLFATAGSPIEPEYLSQLGNKTSWLYVNEASIQEIRTRIQKTGSSYMGMEAFPTSWKTAEALYQAKLVLETIRSQEPSDGLVDQTQHALGDLFQLISQLNTDQKMKHLIDQAKASDRNIACAAFSILMCKTLKFEKNAIVEILGLASFFQDVSLYMTPFGNLSDADPSKLDKEAATYYRHHPLISADLVALQTSVPDVTLQVIRQQHEKKDRTGFPNRIGGMQLHPMAEVLSLINEYLNHQANPRALETAVYPHFSDRMVNAFKSILKVDPSQIAS